MKYIELKLTEHQARFIMQLLHDYALATQEIAPRKSFAWRIMKNLVHASTKIS